MTDYEQSWTSVRRIVTRSAVELAWEQWVALGSFARPAADRIVRRVVDPESLVLLSLAFRPDERRLRDMLRWWAVVGTPLTSLQRMRTVVDRLGGESADHFALFARWAADAGHRSWKRYAAAEAEGGLDEVRGLKGPDELRLIEPSTLMLRMRAAFGVGAKADVLTFLIGMKGAMATVSAIGRAVGYTETSVRDALKDMTLARLIHETTNRPAYYKAAHKPWVALLELERPEEGMGGMGPPWGMWMPIFEFLIAARDLAERTLSGAESEHVASSLARDLFERCSYGFNFHDIAVPAVDAYPGRRFALALLQTVEAVGDWMAREG